jgi:hypothetical protein
MAHFLSMIPGGRSFLQSPLQYLPLLALLWRASRVHATGSPGGSFNETSKNVRCCDGILVDAETDNGVAAALFAAAATAATIAAASDDANLFDRGQTQTPPKAGELTVSELVRFDLTRIDAPFLGINFGGTIKWDYASTLDSGRTLTYSTTNDLSNIHYLKSYKVNVDGTHDDSKHYTHQRKNPLIIGSQFTRPDGLLFRGSQLYVFAPLFSDTGIKIGIELRDDGCRFLDGFPPPDDGPIPVTLPRQAILNGDLNH